MAAKRTAEVWRWLPANSGNAGTAKATQQAIAMRQQQRGEGDVDGCAAVAAVAASS